VVEDVKDFQKLSLARIVALAVQYPCLPWPQRRAYSRQTFGTLFTLLEIQFEMR
jgi:hypothetical protein